MPLWQTASVQINSSSLTNNLVISVVLNSAHCNLAHLKMIYNHGYASHISNNISCLALIFFLDIDYS